MDENVLVVPTEGLEKYLKSAFDPAAARAVIALANKSRLFLPRSQVEQDESYKQIIPYICIRHLDSYVLLQRTKKQSEARLHNKFSLGIGGHINEQEIAAGAADLVQAGLLRELREEITLTEGWKLNLLGTIYDPSTPVGRVHFGIVYQLEAVDRSFTLNEPELMSAFWGSLSEVSGYQDRMETWSQILVSEFLEKGRSIS